MMTIIALVAAGLVLIAGGVFAWTRASAENSTRGSWPSVEGKVTSAAIRSEMEGSGNDKHRVTTFKIEYSYTVDGKAHNGNIYSNSLTHFPALQAKYANGGPVTVFYNPANPGHNDVREPLAQSGNLTTGKIAFFLILLGVVALGGAAFMKFGH